jgi:hypothetical protein
MTRKVSLPEFRRLLNDIHDRRPDVRVRLRLLGKMWGERFCAIDFINEKQVVLFDESEDHYHYINNSDEVVQFELECSFFGFHAFYHYEVLGKLREVEMSMPLGVQSNGS